MAWSLLAHLVQGSTDTNGFTSSALDTTGADFLVVNVGSDQGVTVTMSDSKGNTWATAVGPTTAGFSAISTIFYSRPTSVGSGHTVTVTCSGGSPSIDVMAWSGSTASPLDQTNKADGGGNTTLQAGSITPTVDGCLIVAGCGREDTTGAMTINLSYTIADQQVQANSQHRGSAIAYLVQGTAAASNPTWTDTAAGIDGATIAAFKPAAGGAFLAKKNRMIPQAIPRVANW